MKPFMSSKALWTFMKERKKEGWKGKEQKKQNQNQHQQKIPQTLSQHF